MIWGALIALCSFFVLYTLMPFWRHREPGAENGETRACEELYRSQLAELQREKVLGLLAESEADRVREEILSRLQTAGLSGGKDARVAPASGRNDRYFTFGLALFLIGGSFMLYSLLGDPNVPSPSFAQQDAARRELSQLTQGLWAYLEAKPQEAGAWDALGRALVLSGRYQEANDSYQRGLKEAGRLPALLIGLAEAEVIAAGGRVTSPALAAVEEALARDPHHPTGQYYAGLYAFQQGDLAKALEIWRPLASRVSGDWPLRANLEYYIRAVEQAHAP